MKDDLNYLMNYLGVDYKIDKIMIHYPTIWLNPGDHTIVFFIEPIILHSLRWLFTAYRINYSLYEVKLSF